MTRRDPLPGSLVGRPFSVAEALTAGVSPGRLRSSDLATPFRGVRHASGLDELALRCRALATVWADVHAFAGPTAAMLWGMPLPRRFDLDERLHVSTAPGARAMRRSGVIGTERSTRTRLVVRDGLRLSDPVGCWLELGRFLAVHDLVAVGDFLTTDSGHGRLATRDELVTAVGGAAGRRGLRALRSAVIEIREGAWSRPESLLRLLLTRAGIPEPSLNPRLRVGGRTLIVDLWWPDHRVAVEYDGRHHSAQWAADLSRTELLADAGVTVVHVTASDLFGDPERLVTRVASRLGDRGWTPDIRVDPTASVRFEP